MAQRDYFCQKRLVNGDVYIMCVMIHEIVPEQAKSDKGEGDEAAVPEIAPIDIGDSLPSLNLKTEKGEEVDVSTLTAEKGVIFFLVPKADTRELHKEIFIL